MKKIKTLAKSEDHRIYISQSQDAKKNPLDYATKVRWLTKMFPEVNIEFNRNIKTIFDATQKISDDGYKDVTSSKDTMEELNDLLPDEFQIHIADRF